MRAGINTSPRNYPFRKLRSPRFLASFHLYSIIRERIDGPQGTHRYFDFITTLSREPGQPLLHPVLSAAPSSSTSFSSRRLTRRSRKTIMSNHIIDRRGILVGHCVYSTFALPERVRRSILRPTIFLVGLG